jgi:glycosyltransferase involved in cell wall biosynthesis
MDNPDKPLISVALCTYNGARYLQEQLTSLRNQTWGNLEIIAVDDGSSDETFSILQREARLDPRIKLFRNTQNIGFKRNFETAFSYCQGELIAPCDQDDVWHPQKLERLFSILNHHSLVYCDSELIDGQGKPMGQRASDHINMYQGGDPAAFIFWNCISGHAMLCRREVLKRAMPMPAVIFHDWWLAFVAASIGSIGYLEEPLVLYRQHESSQTDLSGSRARERILDRTGPFARKANWLDTLASLESPHQPWFRKLHKLWCACSVQWIAPQLVRHLSERRNVLTFINPNKSFMSLALKYIWGLKAKAAFNPRRYPATSMQSLAREFGRQS